MRTKSKMKNWCHAFSTFVEDICCLESWNTHTQKYELAVGIGKVCSRCVTASTPRRSPSPCKTSPDCAADSVSGCCSAPPLGYYGADTASDSQRPYPGGQRQVWGGHILLSRLDKFSGIFSYINKKCIEFHYSVTRVYLFFSPSFE